MMLRKAFYSLRGLRSLKVESLVFAVFIAASLVLSLFQLKFNRTSPSVAIIGSCGFIGARLHEHLHALGLKVDGYDRDQRCASSFPTTHIKPSNSIPSHVLQSYETVVYLGGLTSRQACEGRAADLVQQENVGDILALTRRMHHKQLLLFASTSAIAEGSGPGDHFSEESSANVSLLDAYSSSLLQREIALRDLSTRSSAPKMFGFRFGTVLGVSKSQRNGLLHMALVCQAFLKGHLDVSHPETFRGFLWIEDLALAFGTVLKSPFERSSRFEIFHLQSFSASVGNAANEIARLTGAHLFINDHHRVLSLSEFGSTEGDSVGFSLDTRKFLTHFTDFKFLGSQTIVTSELIDNAPHLCKGREVSHRSLNDSMPCVVCGSSDMLTVLDLHDQPLANDFFDTTSQSQHCERFPLKLVKCRHCHHAQLSFSVDRGRLFRNYKYQSGTSSTLQTYFKWLAQKVISECGNKTHGVVLEVASNDGSQLDQFKALGWITHGADPAANLAEIARSKGHIIHVGFWGVDDFPDLPLPSEIDAILAQNVLAHVDSPVTFLRTAAKLMGHQTRAYFQTSQCEMFETGQFDTVYHEHISFFSAHSFRKAATMAGLVIINFEHTPIHGKSCLVTMQLKRATVSAPSRSISGYLDTEISMGLTEDWFYIKYRQRASSLVRWMHLTLTSLHDTGYMIVGYGAAAKGMTLLHFLNSEYRNPDYTFEYVVDDAPLKQNTYCPGTNIPVKPSTMLSESADKGPLVILVFSWNFWDEICVRITASLKQTRVETQRRGVVVILPWPSQRVVIIRGDKQTPCATEVMLKSFNPVPWPAVFPPLMDEITLFVYVFDSPQLLPGFIAHHAALVDKAAIINCMRIDISQYIQDAPSTWINVKGHASCPPKSDALLSTDATVYRHFPNSWKLILCSTDFLVVSSLRHALLAADRASFFQIPVLEMVNISFPLSPVAPFLAQNTQYVRSSEKRLLFNLRRAKVSAELPELEGFVGTTSWHVSGASDKVFDLQVNSLTPEDNDDLAYNRIWSRVFAMESSSLRALPLFVDSQSAA